MDITLPVKKKFHQYTVTLTLLFLDPIRLFMHLDLLGVVALLALFLLNLLFLDPTRLITHLDLYGAVTLLAGSS